MSTTKQEKYDCPTCDDDFSSTRGMKIHHARVHGESLVMETMNCEVCGVEFEYLPSNYENRSCCSYECSNEKAKVSVTIECKVCGDEVEYLPSQYENREYCSHECRGIGSSGENNPTWKDKVEVSCDNCGDELQRLPHRVESSQHNFCGYGCQNEYFTGESSPHWKSGEGSWRNNSRWRETKKLIRQRDDHSCQMCGVTSDEASDTLQVHHITPVYVGGEKYQPENLTTLCSGCHDEAHAALDYPHPNSVEYQRFCERHEIEV